MGFKYRADIDGLRAIAILAVVIFHAAPEVFPGGFVGVDVFFVISGFLISSIVLKEGRDGDFSYLDFYVRRVNRIFPALIIVLAVVLMLGRFVLLPEEFKSLGKHVAAGSVFASNIALYLEVDYFDTAAEFKPLLHLWSLGIEEQFYFILPTVLLWVMPRKRVGDLVLGALLMASFGLGWWRALSAPTESFFLLHTRFWELLVGTMLARFSSFEPWVNWTKKRSNLLALLGVGFLLVGLTCVDNSKAFPGYWALFPVLGAAALIAAGPETFINRKFLAWAPMVRIGLISYPLYLWHWPLLSFAHIVSGEKSVSVPSLLTIVAVSFGLALFTYKAIELPLKRVRSYSRGQIACVLAVLVACLGALGGLSYQGRIRPRSSGKVFRILSDATKDWAFPGLMKIHRKGEFSFALLEGGSPELVFLGDSNTEQFYPRFERIFLETANAERPSIKYVTKGGCPAIPNVTDGRLEALTCPRVVDFAYTEAIDSKVKTVVIGGEWSDYFSPLSKYRIFENESGQSIAFGQPGFQKALTALEHKIRALRNSGKNVFVILNIPTGKELDPRQMLERSLSLRPLKVIARPVQLSRFVQENGGALAELETVARRAGAAIIDPLLHLCGEGICKTMGADGQPLYKDRNHLRASWVRENASFVDAVFEY